MVEIAKIYDPKTAFGNTQLIKVVQEQDAQAELDRTSEICRNCYGKGWIECNFCENTGDCHECEGQGRIKK